MICAVSAQNTMQLPDNSHINRCLTRFHLNYQARTVKTQRASTGEDIDPAVSTPRGFLSKEPFSRKDSGN